MGRFIIEDIEIEGLERITAGTALTYLPLAVGDEFTEIRSPEVIRALFRTGFFTSVELARRGNVLIVKVLERPAINEIRITGNKNITTEALTDAMRSVGLQRGRVFNRTVLDRVENELRQQYLSEGRYNATIDLRILELPRNRVDVEIAIVEGDVARIRAVNLVGNTEYTTRELTRRFESGVPAWWAVLSRRDHYSRQKLSGDLETLRSRYLDAGYLNFAIESSQVTLTPDRRDLYITINLAEGQVYRLQSVELAGELVLDEAELRALIDVQPGDTFSRRAILESAERITQRLGSEGYAFATVNPVPEVDPQSQEIRLTYRVDPGRRTYVRRILISGQERTQESVYRRELRQMEGAWFNRDLVDRSRIRLQRLPFVETVDIETQRVPGRDDEIDLLIEIRERLSGALSVGAGFSQSQGVLLTASLSQENFLGSGNRVTFDISRSDVSQNLNLSVLNPHFTIHGATRGFSVFYRKVDAEEADISRYTTNRLGGTLTYGFPLTENETLSFSPGIEQVEIITVPGTSERILEQLARDGREYTQWTTQLVYVLDSRDRTVFAESGRRHQFGTELALPGSDLQYYRLTYSGQEILKLSTCTSLSFSLGMGYGAGYGKTETLPFFEHFYAGGLRSVRGFRDSSLGPRDGPPNNDPFGGSFRTQGTVELFFPLPMAADNRAVRMSTFVDVGQVYASFGDFSSEELRASTGLAMTWLSPVGPLSLSYGIPLREKPGDETQTVQFLLGGSF